MEDNLNFFLNGRQPHFSWKMEELKGRQPEFSGKSKTPSILG
jgi:hypothetical protein